MSHQVRGTIAFVTGANRGIGRALVEALLSRGAQKVYAAARRPETLSDLVAAHGPRVVPVGLDVTDEAQVRAAVASAPDVRLLINNAGAVGHGFQPIDDTKYLAALRDELDVNVVGLHAVTSGFLPTLVREPGSAIVNLSSVAGFVNFGLFPTYSAAKAAVHSLTQAYRMGLSARGVSVHGVYPGPVDTDMATGIPFDKTSPQDVASAILDGVEQGIEDILPDPMSAQMGGGFFESPKALERQVAAMGAA
jgi:NAD(P)-dependent dehydrogenase (short-subunit alcohol dehydrogenase family)